MLNASKSHHLSIGDPPDHRLVLSEAAIGELMTKYEQINDLGITVNSTADVHAAAKKARGMLHFINGSFTCLTKEIFVPLYSLLVRPHHEYAIQVNLSLLQKGYIPPRMNITGSNEVGERC